MKERLSNANERVTLEKLKTGDVVRITTGTEDAAFQYEFTVLNPGKWPVGQIVETDPAGEVVGSGLFMLQGSGIWTDRRQNPVQTQERAFTSYFDSLSLGAFMVGSNPNTPADRMLFDKVGQEISQVSVNGI